MDTYFRQIDEAYASLSGQALEEALLSVLDACGSEHGVQSLPYASMLSELGGYYRGQRRLEESEQYFQSAADLIAAAAGTSSPNYATAVNNLAGTHRLMGQYDKAEGEFSLCLKLYEAALGREHIFYASALNNLSLICLDRRETQQAAALLEQTADILRALPDCVDELATCLCNTAALYLQQGRFDRAADLYRQAIDLYETRLGTRTPHYHAALHGLGLALRALGNSGEAISALQRGLTAAETLYGPDHPEAGSIRRALQETERPE